MNLGDLKSERWRRVGRVLRIVLPLGVAWLVWHELHALNYGEIRADAVRADRRLLGLGVVTTFATLAIMGLYDVIAFDDHAKLPKWRRWCAGALIFAWTNFLTLGPVGGPALRFLVYRRAGVTPAEMVRSLARMYVGVFAGLGAWLAVVLPSWEWLGFWMRAGAAAVLAPTASAAALAVLGRLHRLTASPGSARRAAVLGFIGFLDWGFVALTFVLAARSLGVDVPDGHMVRTLLVGHAAGIASMIPGGLGSADAVWLAMLTHAGVGSATAGAVIVLFRLVFYVLPWALSLLVLYVLLARRWAPALVWQRRILAGAVGVNALLLLASAATPIVAARRSILDELVPVGVMETTHVLAVVAAGVMLYVMRGLLRGYRSAYLITGAMLAASVVAHLLKGGDYEESLLAVALLLLLLGAPRAFPRRGRVPIGWELALATLAGSVGFFVIVGVLAFRKTEYSNDLWTHFGLHADAGRFLRGAAVLGGVGIGFLVRMAMKPPSEWIEATGAEIDRAVAMIKKWSAHAAPLGVANGDKGVYIAEEESGEALGVAVVQRQSDALLVFSDPATPAGRGEEFLARLLEHAQGEDLRLIFYQLSARWIEHLHEYGFAFFKLGEEAVVELAGFSLEGGERAGLRKTVRRLEGDGITFEVLEPPHDAALLAACREVSDEWLAHKGITEMQFSVGYFSAAYLQRFPLAVVRDHEKRVLAFANVLGLRSGADATIDFMRYRADGPPGLMEYLITRLLVHCAEAGYASFTLGMSPLHDVGKRRGAALMERAAAALYRHGERFYNYKGLHAFKGKFHPRWEPRYMAFQSSWDWASAVVSATTLIRAGDASSKRRIAEARGAFDYGEPSQADV